MYEIQMPKFGQTMLEGEISEWYVKVGDHVDKGDPVCQVSTEKIVNEVETYESGTVKELLYEEGDVVEIGKIICRIEKD